MESLGRILRLQVRVYVVKSRSNGSVVMESTSPLPNGISFPFSFFLCQILTKRADRQAYHNLCRGLCFFHRKNSNMFTSCQICVGIYKLNSPFVALICWINVLFFLIYVLLNYKLHSLILPKIQVSYNFWVLIYSFLF